MQAIVTKYLPCTNTRGSRIKAWCERGSITIPYPHELGSDFKHRSAAEALCRKFAQEDAKKYGSTVEGNPWLRPMIEGGLPRGCGADSVFVFEERK